LVSSLNKAISYSKSEFIARQDADDISLPNRLEKQYYYIKKKKLAVVGSNMIIIDDKGNPKARRRYPTNPIKIKKNILLRNIIAHPTTIFNKEIVISVGGYNPKMLYVQDYDLWLRIINSGYSITNLSDYLVKYRHHKETVKYNYLRETVKNTIKLQLKAFREYKNLDIPLHFPFYLLLELIFFILPTKIGYYLFEKFFIK
jgi:glycosyltransferase involved in cell wall biosynthesis